MKPFSRLSAASDLTLGLIGAVLAVAAVYAGRRWFAMNPIESSDPNLNDRGARLIGETVTVVEAIADHHC